MGSVQDNMGIALEQKFEIDLEKPKVTVWFLGLRRFAILQRAEVVTGR